LAARLPDSAPSSDNPPATADRNSGAVRSSARRAAWIDPHSLMRIKNLELRAKVVVEGFYHGLHRSPYHGFSVEFSEYRQYTPGDDPRYLDWKLYARSDRYYIKRFEDETNLRCYLAVDTSRSMEFGSAGHTKREYAVTLAATLAYFLSTQRDAVGLMTFDEHVREYLPARYRPGHLHRLMLALDRPAGGVRTDLSAPLTQIAELVAKRGLVVLISDLLSSQEHLERDLSSLTSRGHEGVLFQVLDPAELSFGFEAPSLFHDVESGRELYVDPDAVREEYLRRFQAHNDAVEATCQKLDIEYHRLPTDQPLEGALFDFLRARAQRGRTLRRARAQPHRGRPHGS
jgi:uncharacterized protein (DUF58 family)